MRRLPTLFSDVPTRQLLSMVWRLLLSQAPHHDPADQPLPDWADTWMREYDQAIAEAQKALELNPSYGSAYRELGMAYAQKGMHEKAVHALRKGLEFTERHPWIQGLLGYAYATAGQSAEARRVLEELKEGAAKGRFGCAFAITRIHAALNEKEQAFEWLRRACDERDTFVVYLKVDPTMDNLRSDPRFARLVKDMGLPP